MRECPICRQPTNSDPPKNHNEYCAGRYTGLAEGRRQGAIEELEAMAKMADAHGKFCSDEADAGGSPDLRERATGAYYIAGRIRARIKELQAEAGRAALQENEHD